MGKNRKRFNEKARLSSQLKTQNVNPSPLPVEHEGIVEMDQDYQTTTSANPLVILPGQKTGLSREELLNLLPEAPEGKLSSKKRKRLEKFIANKIKKDERNKILASLAEKSMDNKALLVSSKNIGRTNLSKKEKLKTAFLHQKAGLNVLNDDISLFVEKKRPEEMDNSISEDENGMSHDEMDNEDIEEEGNSPKQDISQELTKSLSLLQQAFLAPANDLPTKQVIIVQDGHNSTSIVESAPEPAPAPVFGAALKNTASDKASKRKLKIQKRKAERAKLMAEQQKNESDTGSESEQSESDQTLETKDEAVWMSNVVDGEKLPVLERNYIPQPKEQPAECLVEKPPAAPRHPAFYVPVNRLEQYQLSRVALPVVAEEAPIMEAIIENDVIVLCGETGSGKTTQVPQFLYEAGFGDPKHPKFKGMVGITQPRRVAAISMAQRVSQELNLHHGEVAYQVRYDASTVNANTRIKFMTDGILLRELSSAASKSENHQGGTDLLLTKYSCIIVDEAHERTVGTDVLIGWLTRIVTLRNSGSIKNLSPLKLVIMSATLRVEDFTENKKLFPLTKPPVLKVDGRQYKVVIHYNRKTPELDYVSEAYKKVSKIHRQLPPGGILVFLTGQQEIQILVKKLRKEFSEFKIDETVEQDEKDSVGLLAESEPMIEAETEDLDIFDSDFDSDDEEEEVEVLDGASDDEAEAENAKQTVSGGLYVLPLYSMMSNKAQMRIFDPVPAGTRLCVVATNVAETSLTIPGIRYVVDCGKIKEKKYDSYTGIQQFRVGWTSKASSDQRAGRAGRVGPGHCYRLFSSAVFNNHFKQFSVPEILRVPVEDVALQMKSMGINQVVHFPFPTAPSEEHLKSAETLLAHLGAIDIATKQKKVTALGRLMAQLPVSPRFSKMLILAAQQKLEILEFMIMLVSGLSVGSPFIREDSIHTKDEEVTEDADEQRTERREYFRIMQLFASDEPTSDSIRLLRAIGAYMSEVYHSANADQLEKFCERHFLRFKGMEEIRKLKQQLTFIMQSAMDSKQFPALNALNTKPKPPTNEECSMIRQILLAGYGDHVARFDLESSKTAGRPVYSSCFSDDKTQQLAIHPGSCIFSTRPSPKYIIYETLVGREQRVEVDNSGFVSVRKEVVNEKGETIERIWMEGSTIVNEKWLAKIGPVGLVNNGSILSDPEPKYDAHSDQVMGYIKPTYGPKCWELSLRQTPLNDSDKKCWYFAKALLEGRVFGEGSLFKLLQPYLKWKPSVITKSMSNKAVRDLVSALIVKKVNSKASLLALWSSNPRWLMTEYAQWVPEVCQPFVQKTWSSPSQLSLSQKQELLRLLSSTKKSQPTIDQVDSDYDSDF